MADKYKASMELSVFWDGFIKATKVHKCFGLVSPPDNPTSLVGFFFSDESFIPLSSATSADSAALQDLVSSSGMSLKSGDVFVLVFRFHYSNCVPY